MSGRALGVVVVPHLIPAGTLANHDIDRAMEEPLGLDRDEVLYLICTHPRLRAVWPDPKLRLNVTLDRCCDHRAISPDEEMHRHATEILAQADALLFGRVTYEMMESAWRPPGQIEAMPDWMAPFGRTIDAAKKYVVSSTLDRVDWNA